MNCIAWITMSKSRSKKEMYGKESDGKQNKNLLHKIQDTFAGGISQEFDYQGRNHVDERAVY